MNTAATATRAGEEGDTLNCAPSADAVAGNGGPLNCAPSADAVAGNGGPLNCAPSADAVAGGGDKGETGSGALQQLYTHVVWRLDKGNPDTGPDGTWGHGEDGATLCEFGVCGVDVVDT